MVFFTDRDLGLLFPRILSEAGLSVETHDAHFAHDTPDVEWLPAVGHKGWFVVSKDRRIRYRPNEQAAAMRAGVGLFLLVGVASHDNLARNFANSIARIERFARKQERPFIAKVYRPARRQQRRGRPRAGRVELWLSHEEWRFRQRGE